MKKLMIKSTTALTEEEKDLLLKDLYARLPYGVKVAIEYSKGKYTHIYDLRKIDNDSTTELRQQVTVWNYGLYNTVISYPLIHCRPYLRPRSSITEEEKQVLELCDTFVEPRSTELKVDFYNKQHLDYRGFVENGLAIAVTKDNNPYEY